MGSRSYGPSAPAATARMTSSRDRAAELPVEGSCTLVNLAASRSSALALFFRHAGPQACRDRPDKRALERYLESARPSMGASCTPMPRRPQDISPANRREMEDDAAA